MMRLKRLFTCLLAVSMLLVSVWSVSAETCQIPASGPWPACATNGNSTPSTNTATCVIPQQGPWPTCVTNNSNSQPQAPSSNNAAACTIPATGPWPPCARQGTATTQPAPATTPKPTDWNDRSSIIIYEAYITPKFASPTQAPMLHWRTNADFVVIGWRAGDTYDFPCPNVASGLTRCKGSGSISLAGASGQSVNFGAYIAQGGDDYLTESRHFDIKCNPDAWFFETDTPDYCPEALPQTHAMQQQLFERGMMLFSNQGNSSWVYILTYDDYKRKTSGRWDAIQVVAGQAPRDSNPKSWAPQNREKPLYELGAVWGNDGINDELGWALSPVTDYDGYTQSYDNVYNGTIFLSHSNSKQVLKLTYSSNSLTWTTFERSGEGAE